LPVKVGAQGVDAAALLVFEASAGGMVSLEAIGDAGSPSTTTPAVTETKKMTMRHRGDGGMEERDSYLFRFTESCGASAVSI
jgi:hypothetical protein